MLCLNLYITILHGSESTKRCRWQLFLQCLLICSCSLVESMLFKREALEIKKQVGQITEQQLLRPAKTHAAFQHNITEHNMFHTFGHRVTPSNNLQRCAHITSAVFVKYSTSFASNSSSAWRHVNTWCCLATRVTKTISSFKSTLGTVSKGL